MIATVIICTRNRAASLARTLSSLATSAKRVREPWELIIVDNGSTDHTRDVVESFAAELPLARIDQPIPGLSNARNAGVAAAHGNYILWTDDDVIVDERWLTAWFATFKRRPHDVVFGGRSEPLLEEPHQPWFHANMGNLASLLAIWDEPTWGEVTVERIPYGLNYAIRASEQRAHLYDTNLGSRTRPPAGRRGSLGSSANTGGRKPRILGLGCNGLPCNSAVTADYQIYR